MIALLCLTIAATAQTPPVLTTYLEKWHRHHVPVNSWCLVPAFCGSPQSPLPQSRIVDSLYSKTLDGLDGTFGDPLFILDKKRITLNVSSPAYHSQSTIVERFIQFSNFSAGTLVINHSSDNGETFQVDSEIITDLDVGETFSRGSLTRTVTDDRGHAANTFEVTDTSTAVVGVTGGAAKYEFTYLVPVRITEHIMDHLGGLVPVNPPIVPLEVRYAGGVVNLGPEYPGYVGLRFKVRGGRGFQRVDITPTCDRPFYFYSFLRPLLANVRPYNPDDLDND